MTGKNRLIISDPMTKWVTLAASDNTGQLVVLGINLFLSSTSTTFTGIKLSSSPLIPQSAGLSSDGKSFYIGAMGTFSTFPSVS
jgi:hypothetical protein